MALTIDYTTRIITVPKADMALVQATPTEIRQLDLNDFRLELKDIEDSVGGMPFVDTHNHNTEVLLGGITYARVIEIINGYTVTFEDGQYAVNLVGANSNVGDVVNVNQVSVRSANSAGLISNQAVEYSSYGGGVHIDATSSNSGTIFPVGTPQAPVNNLDDAILIAEFRGFDKLFIIGDYTFGATASIDSYEVVGQGITKTNITFTAGANLEGCELFDATVTGSVSGLISTANCLINDLTLSELATTSREKFIKESLLQGTLTMPSNFEGVLLIVDSWSNVAGTSTPTLDLNDSASSLIMRAYSGGIELTNITQGDVNSIDLLSGQVKVDSSCTNGFITVRGVGNLTDNSGIGLTVKDVGLLNQDLIADATWNEATADHRTVGTTGAAVQKKGRGWSN